MSLWQKRAALPILLAHSAHRRHTKPQEFRNLPGALAPFIKLQNALAHRNRYGSHGHTLPYAFLFIKLYYLWKCSSLTADPSPHVSQLGRKEINVGSLGLVREFCVALLVALRVFRFEQ